MRIWYAYFNSPIIFCFSIKYCIFTLTYSTHNNKPDSVSNSPLLYLALGDYISWSVRALSLAMVANYKIMGPQLFFSFFLMFIFALLHSSQDAARLFFCDLGFCACKCNFASFLESFLQTVAASGRTQLVTLDHITSIHNTLDLCKYDAYCRC